MAEAEPIIEQIAVSLAAGLAAVKAADGYRNTLARIIRPTKNPVQGLAHLDTLLFQGNDVRSPAGEPSQAMAWEAHFVVAVNIVESELDTTPLDTYLNRVRADVHKALRADYSRGGVAVDTQFQTVAYGTTEDGYDMLLIPVSVQYEHADADPYSL